MYLFPPQITGDKRTSMEQSGDEHFLQIADVTAEDAAVYTAEMVSSRGSVKTLSFTVTVEGEIEIT